ncbi:outer membrane protein [Bradyrhizobium prioriisuperbiae]|uniref:outer membrane protein n=1 Tax=Bradyrhizobium prioriisuperbiae TaxID=2854389 RepID=UPI0028E96808|nr:outer membrane beta-barrel protein [Bradyrhizobium prioritasuperba]
MKVVALGSAALALGTALVAGAGAASAADLPARVYTKAPPMLVQAYNWTGFYAGVNAGVGFGRSKTDLAVPGLGDEHSRLGGLGALGGAQIGYNLQTGNFLGLGNIVFGVEADIQGADLQDNRTCYYFCAPGAGAAINQKLDWFGTARGRVGIASGPVFSYFTGGFAYGNVKTTITDLSGLTAPSTFSSTRTGWTIGSGVEAALGGNWTGKVEYLYVDLGTQSGINTAVPYTYSSEIREHIFRAGLNYRFGGTGVYAPEPVANWTGFYIGGNGGGATALNKSSLQDGAVNEKFNLSPDGYFGGAQIGYNWQAANWVWGLEADIQGGSLKDNFACLNSCDVATSTLIAFNQKMEWFGTVRGRLGYSVGSSLFYATGGLAYGNVKTQLSGANGPGIPIDESFSHTKVGYAVGGGIESPFDLFGWFGKNWTSKTEYLFVDLGKSTDSVSAVPGLTFTTHAQEHMLRTGLNYHFNSPVVAKY